MFYNARMYDPILSGFISADSIAPDMGNSKDRNRYSYVRNNPMRFIDPTGHEAEDNEACDAGGSNQSDACREQIGRFRHLGIGLAGIWTLQELGWVWDALMDLKRALGGESALMAALGTAYDVVGFTIERLNQSYENYTAAWNDDRLYIYNGMNTNAAACRGCYWKRWMVHEFAHRMDNVSYGTSGDYDDPENGNCGSLMWLSCSYGGYVSDGGNFVRKCYDNGCGMEFDPSSMGTGASSYYPERVWEDFAEAVTAWVYQNDVEVANADRTNKLLVKEGVMIMDARRQNFMRMMFDYFQRGGSYQR